MSLLGVPGAAGPAAGDTADVREALGLTRAPRTQRQTSADQATLSAGQPASLNPHAASSAALATTLGTPFDEVALLGDFDGAEDLTADRDGKIDDFSQKPVADNNAFALTRVAVSAHTLANGFNENVFYYGDTLGNVHVAQSPSLGTRSTPLPAGGLAGANIFSINLPSALNAFGSLLSDDQVVVTGLCVNPVADLSSFANVNGAYSSYNGLTGEILYVTFLDLGAGLRLASNNTVVKSGLLAFPVADIVSGTTAPPAIVSPTGFPVQVGGSFGVAFSTFSNVAGCAVDDDGSVYFQNADLVNLTGANIVKVTDTGANQDRSAAVNGFITITTLNPAGGVYGTTSGPTAQANRFTNYSGTSTTFGNIASLAAGRRNVLFAALAASRTGAAPTQGMFTAPAALGPTPSMLVSFADAIGATAPVTGLPIADGIADVVAGAGPLQAGVNNFRAFVLGNGPDRRAAGNQVFGTASQTLKLDMQIDHTAFSGLAVDEEGRTFVISGATPAGAGRDPSPEVGEILAFTDDAPEDRRADYVDFRGNLLPEPPASGGNVGDGDSDRFDHVWHQANGDPVTLTPAGMSGLSRGFLRYLNRTAPNAVANLPNGTTQGDDASHGPIFFDDDNPAFDPSRQVAGGDDQTPPFRGDDSGVGGTGQPPLSHPLAGGFELAYGTVDGGPCQQPWNAFFLNSNGSISFGAGTIDATPTQAEFLSLTPRIAPAWANLNPASRTGGALNTFPVQALGYASPNHFKVRWINVPEAGGEGAGSSNSFSVSLFDDGWGSDENASAKPEGPVDARFVRTQGGFLLGTRVRPAPSGRGPFVFEYGRMDLRGSSGGPVIAGFSAQTGPGTVPELDLSEAGRTQVVGAANDRALYELFDAADFDLRFEGNSALTAKPPGQPDPNRERIEFAGRTCTRPPNAPIVVTGPGQGRAPTVKVLDAITGLPRMTITPYAPGFTGGVRVAVGDVTGDGINDIVTAPGPGSPPTVKVFNGRNGAQLPAALGAFDAYESTFTGGVFVAVGDVNSDGRADIITGPDAGRAPSVRVFSGLNRTLIRNFLPYASSFVGGVRVASADVSGDGVADLVTGPGSGIPARVRVFNGPTGAQLPGAIGNFLAYPTSFTGGVFVASANVGGDGKADVITGPGSGAPLLKAFNGADAALLASFQPFPSTFTGGVRVGVVNLRSADGRPAQQFSILSARGPGSVPQVRGQLRTQSQTLNLNVYEQAFSGGSFVAGNLN